MCVPNLGRPQTQIAGQPGHSLKLDSHIWTTKRDAMNDSVRDIPGLGSVKHISMSGSLMSQKPGTSFVFRFLFVVLICDTRGFLSQNPTWDGPTPVSIQHFHIQKGGGWPMFRRQFGDLLGVYVVLFPRAQRPLFSNETCGEQTIWSWGRPTPTEKQRGTLLKGGFHTCTHVHLVQSFACPHPTHPPPPWHDSCLWYLLSKVQGEYAAPQFTREKNFCKIGRARKTSKSFLYVSFFLTREICIRASWWYLDRWWRRVELPPHWRRSSFTNRFLHFVPPFPC